MSSRLATFGRLAGLLRPTSRSAARDFLSIMARDCAPDCAQSMPNIEQSADFSGAQSGTQLAVIKANAKETPHDSACPLRTFQRPAFRSPRRGGVLRRSRPRRCARAQDLAQRAL